MDLSGRVAAITGAGRGIGRAIALGLARAGAEVVCLARTKDQLEETERQILADGGRASSYEFDVTNEARVEDVVSRIVTGHGRIDLWINNAGRFKAVGPTWDVAAADWLMDVQVNLFGTYLCIRAVVPHMLRQGHGRIINLVGGGTAAPLKHASAYGSSKAAVARLTDTLAAEFGDGPLKVFALNPGRVRTEMTESIATSGAGRKYLPALSQAIASGSNVPPEKAAEAVLFLASGRADALSGRIISVHDDLGQLVADAERIVKSHRHALRVT